MNINGVHFIMTKKPKTSPSKCMHRLRSTRVIKWGEELVFSLLPPLFPPSLLYPAPLSPPLFFIRPLFLPFSPFLSVPLSQSFSYAFLLTLFIFFLHILSFLPSLISFPPSSPFSRYCLPLPSRPLLNVKESIVGQDYEKAKLWNFPNSS